jgi:hypothetical protein
MVFDSFNLIPSEIFANPSPSTNVFVSLPPITKGDIVTINSLIMPSFITDQFISPPPQQVFF